MKRINALLAIVLCAVVLAITLQPVSAQTESEEAVQLPKANDIFANLETPISCNVLVDIEVPENASLETRSASCEYIEQINRIVRVDADFVLIDRKTSDDEWAQLMEMFQKTVLDYIRAKGEIIPDDLCNQLMNLLYAERSKASNTGENEESLWAQDKSVILTSLSVTTPYYIELTNGASGNAVRRLQQRLIELGYLTGAADGHFGPMTKKSVEELEQYVRLLEQDVINVQFAADPEPVSTPEPTEVANEEIAPENEANEALESAKVIKPEPTTVVDGIADISLQALVFSQDFPTTRAEINTQDSGDAVVRLQRRLISLGYLTGNADGILGGNSQRGIRLFQYYNGLQETGNADTVTQNLLFSAEAKAPDFPLMVVGSKGDAVKAMQKRLFELGFLTITPDGDFGNSTKLGIQNLQAYMREQEKTALIEKMTPAPAPVQESDEAGEAPSEVTPISIDESLLTIEVNGIADPLLLDAFYSESFPAVPGSLKQGDSNIEVARLQRRLYALEYLFTAADGIYGGNTANAVTKFQARNNLAQTGIADKETLSVMFSEKAFKALKPYVLKVSVADQRVYAYGLDSKNEHTVLVRTMKCSTGLKATPTITGTFQSTTGPGARWHYFKKFKCWAQYAFYIKGDYMFHSVLYNQKNGPVTQSSVNNLGRRASHGCVRLSVEDAKWIYNNCPPQTKIIVQ